MDVGEQLKEDLREGRINTHRLIDLILTLQRKLHEAEQRIAELEKQLAGCSTPKVAEPFSMRAEDKRQETRGKNKPKGRRGRIISADKVAQAESTEEIIPEGLDKGPCQLSPKRPVCRLEKGRAVLIAYHIDRGPKNHYGKIPGVLGRSEFRHEIV